MVGNSGCLLEQCVWLGVSELGNYSTTGNFLEMLRIVSVACGSFGMSRDGLGSRAVSGWRLLA